MIELGEMWQTTLIFGGFVSITILLLAYIQVRIYIFSEVGTTFEYEWTRRNVANNTYFR